MKPGDVLDHRFEIAERAGAGGMGEVFRAVDRIAGAPVAIKVLHEQHAGDASRFLRESGMLARFSHPGIVRYMTQGTAPSGAPYLVMEWLDGEDLGVRLERGRLSVDDAITLMATAADALSAVHHRGIVHRDLKPTNLFLVSGEVARVKLLDFGIACLPEAPRITRSGIIIGTPAYMAPEQARSGLPIDARADVFALGCVLFECLTGTPAFSGEHMMDMLLKILLEEVPRVREFSPETPLALDVLCARMLAKDPDARPRDGAAVAAEIETLRIGERRLVAGDPGASERGASSLTQREHRVRSIVLAGPEPCANAGATQPDAETRLVSASEEMRKEAATWGGQLELLADGSILVTLAGAGLATDQAAQAARCSLSLRAQSCRRPMALATGRAELAGTLPSSDLVDRAIRTLAQAAPSPDAGDHEGRAAPIAVDEVTAGLLDARFEVVETAAGLWLHGEQALAEGARTLLGKPTACVGRDWEIATLEAMLAECIDASRLCAALLTAPAGVGKTRVATELLRRVEQRGDPVAIWIGRGDPLRAGAPLGLLAQALQGACGIRDGEPLDIRRDKLRARVSDQFVGADARRVWEFLGELLGTPFPDEESAPLRAARGDTRLLGDQMRRAWVDFLDASCAARPVLLLLEDLHWGDVPTVQYVNEALRRIERRPWMLLVLARPEVHELFPGLWAGQVHEIRLKSLSAKAGARLVRQVLGDHMSTEAVERLVTQANGNAFYLEELIRAAAEGKAGAVPETVLAMVQSRLESLDDASRRILRAGSVLGEVFWRGATLALLGEAGGTSIDERIERLEREEWISSRAESRFQGEQEICFRHALVREAAYGMLTEDDRALGHRLAGEWLVRAAEPSAAVIAEHFDRGGVSERAANFYWKAAAQALAANDLGAVLARAERALSLGAHGEAQQELLLLQTEAHLRRGELGEAGRCARAAMDLLPKGSAPWYVAVDLAGRVARDLVNHDRLAALADELAGSWTDEVSAPAVVATASTANSLLLAGLYDRAEALHARIAAVAERFADDPVVSGAIYRDQAFREMLSGDPAAGRALCERAVACQERAGHPYKACVDRIALGFAERRLGAHGRAVAVLRAAVEETKRMGWDRCLGMALQYLGLALCCLGALEEARAVETEAIEFFAAKAARWWEGISRTYLADILRLSGELEAAETEARRAVGLLDIAKPQQVVARATLANTLLARGRAAEALAEACESMAMIASLSKVEGEALARVVHAEALLASGDHSAARAAIADARDRVLGAAARIEDPRWRDSFLCNVPENARSLELARAWLGEEGS